MSDELAIDLRSVSKVYEQRGAPTFSALAEVSFSVQPRELVAIVGKSGSGKSTLLNLLAGLDTPSGGSVRVAGTKLDDLSENARSKWRGRHVGVVFQFFQLLPTLTVVENVVLAMELVGHIPIVQREPRARELLELVEIADQAGKLPATLSGGQQQRAAIARALANNPAVVVADEPTGNLDSATSDAVVRVFRKLVDQGKTLVIVTHDTEIAGHASRVLRLVDGRLSESAV